MKLSTAYGIEGKRIAEGYDFMKISQITSAILNGMRKAKRPVVLEIATCRYKEHVGPGEDFDHGYRDRAIVDQWKAKDPLIMDSDLIEEFAPPILREIEAAVKFAEESPLPNINDLLTDI
jgi:pyruvate dehydrogenase E1 component alpha subunit